MFNAPNCSRFWQSLYEERNIFHTVKMAVGNSIERQGFFNFCRSNNRKTSSLEASGSVLTKNQTIFCFQTYIGIPGMLSMRLNVVEHLFIVFEYLFLFFVFAFEAWTLHFPLLESYFQIFVDTNNFIFFIFLWKVCSSMPFCKICESPAFLMYTFFKIFVFVSKFSILICFHTKIVHDKCMTRLSLRACALPRGTENSVSYTTVYP